MCVFATLYLIGKTFFYMKIYQIYITFCSRTKKRSIYIYRYFSFYIIIVCACEIFFHHQFQIYLCYVYVAFISLSFFLSFFLFLYCYYFLSLFFWLVLIAFHISRMISCYVACNDGTFVGLLIWNQELLLCSVFVVVVGCFLMFVPVAFTLWAFLLTFWALVSCWEKSFRQRQCERHSLRNAACEIKKKNKLLCGIALD